MFQSKQARRSAQLLWRCESHETAHCVWGIGPGFSLSSPIQRAVTTASDASRLVTMCFVNGLRPSPCPRFMGLCRVESTLRLRLPGWRFFAAGRLI